MSLPATKKKHLVSLDHGLPIICYRISLKSLLNNSNFRDTNTAETNIFHLKSRILFHGRSGLMNHQANDSALNDKPLPVSQNFRKKEKNLILKHGGSETNTDPQNMCTGFSSTLWQLLTLPINLSTSLFRKTARLLLKKYKILTLNFEALLFLVIFSQL